VLYRKMGRQADSTEWRHRTTIRNALAESAKNGNQLTRWFKPGPTGHLSTKCPHNAPGPVIHATRPISSSHPPSPVVHCPTINQMTTDSESEEEEATLTNAKLSLDSHAVDTTDASPPQSLTWPSSPTPSTSEFRFTKTLSPSPDEVPDDDILAQQEENYDDFGNVNTSPLPMISKPFLPAPLLNDASTALKDLQEILRPSCNTGAGYRDPGLGPTY
jgi:hypothetical protein